MGNKQPALTTDGWRPSRMFKQVDRLVAASEATPDPAFLHRILALCCLPRTDPGARFQYKRVTGPYTLVMIAGGDNKLPYGPLPRLMMAYVCREAVQNRKPEVLLGGRRVAGIRHRHRGRHPQYLPERPGRTPAPT